MTWRVVGKVDVTPGADRLVVGSVEAPDVGGLTLGVCSQSPVPFHFGQCLLSFESSYGRELGTLRVWPRAETTVYQLGAGMRVRDRSGVLVLEPRNWNLRWIQAGFPLSVLVLIDQPVPALADAIPAPGIATPEGVELFLTPAGEAGRLTFPA